MVCQWPLDGAGLRGGAVSADTHISAPSRGVPGFGGDDGGRTRQQQAVLTDEHAHQILASASPWSGPLRWDRDRSVDLPRFERRPPRLRQLMGVCGWAAILGVVGLVVGIRGFIGDLLGAAPGWYEPAMIAVGLVGIGLTVGAFVTVHRRRTPYILLGAATLVLVYAMTLTASVF
jgi:hypothetical protein